jgi:hypothetical protein
MSPSSLTDTPVRGRVARRAPRVGRLTTYVAPRDQVADARAMSDAGKETDDRYSEPFVAEWGALCIDYIRLENSVHGCERWTAVDPSAAASLPACGRDEIGSNTLVGLVCEHSATRAQIDAGRLRYAARDAGRLLHAVLDLIAFTEAKTLSAALASRDIGLGRIGR